MKTAALFASLASASAEVVDSATKGHVQLLARQMIMAQTNFEQRVRSTGGSGLTQTRSYKGGSRAFHTSSDINGLGAASLHNHADFHSVLGMAEFGAVLNGVEFWTRHNDYGLRTPSKTSNKYHATEQIKYPDVPPAVLAEPTIAKQIVEMRAWFKAWVDQDHSIRDYRPYFKPVLSYLEGAWIKDHGEIREPFASDRHHIDAKTWSGLHDKSRFLLMTGRKNNLENLPYLPSAVRDMEGENNDVPATANWEYRIGCVELKNDVPLSRIRTAKNLMNQLMTYPASKTQEQLKKTRKARFEVNQADSNRWFEGVHMRGFLDTLMEQIPGKDNFQANMTEYAYGERSLTTKGETLNVGYYSRFYSVGNKDASGRSTRKRGFNDPTMWAAMTKHPRVSGLSFNDGYGPTKCTLSDKCLTDIRNFMAINMKHNGVTGDDLWKKSVFEATNLILWKNKCVEAKTCNCPQVETPVAANYQDWKSDTTYHNDQQLMCRWKVKEEFYNKYVGNSNALFNEGVLPEPTLKNPTCGILDPGPVYSEMRKCPRAKTHQKWSYAVPLEIIYMTPLNTWNPYKLKTNTEAVQTLGGRVGGKTKETAWDGVSGRNWYLTPSEFFSGTTDTDLADTAKRGAGVLDPEGNIRSVEASGVYTTLPAIEGVATYMRTRFPIYPTHAAGNAVWKELKALEAVQLTGNQAMTKAVREEALGAKFELTFAAGHVHTIQIPGHILVTKLAKEGQTYVASSSLNNGHEHQVTIKRVAGGKFEMVSMDPPEPHRLISLTATSNVKDSAIKADGALNAAPVNAAAEPEPEAEVGGAVAQSVNTTKMFSKLFAKLGEVQSEVSILKANAANKDASCAALGEVKTLLADIKN
jgi:hypothetical protein